MSLHPVRRIVASVASLTLLVLVAVALRSSDHATPVTVAPLEKDPAAAVEPAESPTPTVAPSAQPTEGGTPTPDAATDEATPAPPRQVERVETKADKPRNAKPKPIDTPKRSLYLAVGHGRASDGKMQVGSIDPRTGQREIDAAAVIVDAMVDVLKRAPNIRLWAESGRDHPNLVGSVARANRRGAQDCIEVHQDWHRAPPGAFAHWYPSARGARTLANRLVRGLRDEGLDFRPRWHKPRSELYFLRETKCRAVLVEVGRVGDFSKKELREYGRALAVAYIKEIRDR